MNKKTVFIYIAIVLASLGFSQERIDKAIGSNPLKILSNKEIEIKDFVIKQNNSNSNPLQAAHYSHSSHSSHSSHYSHYSGR